MWGGSRGSSRPPRTWRWRSGRGSVRSCPRDRCGRSGCGRRTRTGQRSVIKSETRARRGRGLRKTGARRRGELRTRYTAADVGVLTEEEARRFLWNGGTGDPRTDVTLAWELLYRLEPELYDRLASAEHLHPGVVAWLPHDVDRIVEVGAGTGRLTLELIGHARRVVAVEPALPLRRILRRK